MGRVLYLNVGPLTASMASWMGNFFLPSLLHWVQITQIKADYYYPPFPHHFLTSALSMFC